ncbi:MAG TPA: phospho-N-acetylmuramoyl-pentapeptide-transferase [Candidatus Magasanikbacteria bacterium]|nr:phospho-N-acetylmuramoyl-pentapeptide-transferase [Candidatus Magasanikbacteria bacterium]
MMSFLPFSPNLLQQALLYAILAAIGAFILAPVLVRFLLKFKITRSAEYDFTLKGGERLFKVGTPIMGGLLVIIVVTTITLLFNWERSYTYVPIGVMGISAFLGAADDLLNIFGKKRRNRTLPMTLTLIRVHKKWYVRLWYILTLPWVIFQRSTAVLGSHPGKGVLVHEKLLLQFLAGAITAWWIYFKLGNQWHTLWIPFDGFVSLSWWIIPLVIFLVMFTANAVNIADGLDGLAGGSLLITFAGLTAISWIEGRAAFTLLNATVMGALIAYTYFNVKPARFQMGDVGTLGLGALLAINVMAINKTILLPILGFIFYVEALSVILQVFCRRFLGRRLFKMSPLHHHFEFKGWSEEKIVMRFWLVHFFFILIAIWLAMN